MQSYSVNIDHSEFQSIKLQESFTFIFLQLLLIKSLDWRSLLAAFLTDSAAKLLPANPSFCKPFFSHSSSKLTGSLLKILFVYCPRVIDVGIYPWGSWRKN